MNRADYHPGPRLAAVLLCVTTATFAADADRPAPDSALEIIQFKAPAGWQPADRPGQLSKIFLAPDSNPFQPAYIVIGLSNAQPNFDFRTMFDNAVKAVVGNGTIAHPSPITPAKTRQGFEALSQTFVAQAAGQQLFVRMVSAKVNDRMATFALFASTQQLYDRHQADLDTLLSSVSFNAPAAGPNAPAGNAAPNAEWAALEARKQQLLKELAEIDARQRQLAGVPAAPAQGTAQGPPSQTPPTPPPAAPNQADLLKQARDRFTKEADARRKPHTVIGDILGLDGKPIPNVAAYSIYVKGTTVAAAERTGFNLDVDSNGHFEQQLPDGVYRVYASCVVTCAGHRVPVDLESLDGKPMTTDQSSDRGIVKDYRLVLDGLKPGEDPNGLYSFYGGNLELRDISGDMEKNLSIRYPGSKVRLTLTPQGALVDGSSIRPFTIEMDSRQIAYGNPRLRRLPLGHYALSATLIGPQGQARPLVLARTFQGPYGPNYDLYWECSEGNQDTRNEPVVFMKD